MPPSIAAQSQSWRWRRHNSYCFTITEISYLVVGLFHDLVQPPHNDACDATFLALTYVPCF